MIIISTNVSISIKQCKHTECLWCSNKILQVSCPLRTLAINSIYLIHISSKQSNRISSYRRLISLNHATIMTSIKFPRLFVIKVCNKNLLFVINTYCLIFIASHFMTKVIKISFLDGTEMVLF